MTPDDVDKRAREARAALAYLGAQTLSAIPPALPVERRILANERIQKDAPAWFEKYKRDVEAFRKADPLT